MHRSTRQGGFSLLELMIVMGIMMTLMVIVMRYMGDSIKISTFTSEMTEAQQNLRTAQDFIARDILTAGDGMEDIKSPRMTKTFLNGYLTKAPAPDTDASLGVLGIVTSDDQVPSGTAIPIPSPSPATTVPLLAGSDRLTIMKIDPTFNGGATIPLAAGKVTGNGQTVTLPAGTDMTQFTVGDIYFFTSVNGSAFGAVTAVNAAGGVLTFAAGDLYNINQVASTGPINVVVGGGTKAASMMRMLVVNYFIDSTGLLRRRVFGVSGGVGFTDTVIAEHVANIQTRYYLGQSDSSGNVVAPVTQLTTEAQQGYVRQVEVTLTTETAHAVVNGNKQQISMTGATSVRNLQFNTHLRPTN
jgi:type II secretory pathway pseudopilin PulG